MVLLTEINLDKFTVLVTEIVFYILSLFLSPLSLFVRMKNSKTLKLVTIM
jgi:hypothetical protein